MVCRLACLAALVAAAGSLPADDRGPGRDAFRGDAFLSALEGEWEAVSVVHGGQPADERGTRVTFRDGRMSIRERGGRKGEEYGYRLPRARGPAGPVDVVILEGPEKGKIYPGIYRAEGDALRLCVRPAPGGGRPPAFASAKGSSDVLLTLRRARR